MSCQICLFNIFDFGVLCSQKEMLREFLMNHGVILRTCRCSECDCECRINESKEIFICDRYRKIKDAHKKKINKRCKFKKSIYANSWFSKRGMTVEQICKLTAIWILMKPPRQTFTMESLDLTSKTVVNWFSYCRSVCLDWCADNSEMLGGEGRTVEIDEAKIGKRKYNRGRWLDGYWIFGGIERESKKIFIVQVKDRTADELCSVIRNWILPGTTIISDMWRSYRDLSNQGFEHLTVNHSINFVDPDTGAHTNSIERIWRDVRSSIPRYGTRKKHSPGYLAEFLFKRSFPKHKERLHHFFTEISKSFPPSN